ncbi:3-hexulose-6-phosphate synthase [Metabacillus sp. RGM 3146]|uniref:3-hexulose-6-phosphate synthase n=1 Tax=Metabacillus sp. RGM 3146 TaxID=3401092 RepID=UPI003B9C271C
MLIQLAIDRLSIEAGIETANKAREHIEWIEVGTSLIKEYGMESVRRFKEAFPDKSIVADMKTMDNAVYEMKICLEAGADVATVMGSAPYETIAACVKEADHYGKKIMIDLLNTDDVKMKQLLAFKNVIFCFHVSKDIQELGKPPKLTIQRPEGLSQKIAAAGGITLQTFDELAAAFPDVLIIGSAITKAEDPALAAKEFADKIQAWESAVK